MTTRLAAWLYTGPLGHLAAGIADWAVLLWCHRPTRLQELVRRVKPTA